MSTDDEFERRLKEIELLIGKPLSLLDLPPEEEHSSFAATQPPISITAVVDEIPATKKEVDSEKHLHKEIIPEEPENSDGLAYNQLQPDDLVAESTQFCPWKAIQTYPDRFIGKANRPRARPYFEAILQVRDWDFFYVCDQSKTNQMFLLVPTEQFESFLESVNRRLCTQLCIPHGDNAKRFSLYFDLCGPFRPRYLQRTMSALESEPEKKDYKFDVENEETWPKGVTPPREDWESLSWKGAELFLANMKMLKSCKPYVDKINAEERAINRQKYRTQKMKDAQRLLGLDGSEANAVLVSIDVEALETQPGCVSEIGIAIFDTENVRRVVAGTDGSVWWPFIGAHHLRVKEYSGLVNYRYVQGCPDRFDFGESTFPTRDETCDAVRAILEPYTNNARRLVLVGHDVVQDIGYLDKLGLDMKTETNMVGKLDSQVLHQAWQDADPKRSLSSVLNDLEFRHTHLHNAGNDAVYTLRAVIGLAIIASKAES